MGVFSARTIITTISLFHIIAGYYFITSPVSLADHSLVFVIGEAMGMPQEPSLEKHSPALAFMAVIIAIMGLTDLVSLTLPEEVCIIHHWGTQAPLRLFISLILLAYTFAFSPSSPIYADPKARGHTSRPDAHSRNPGYVASSWGGDGLKNRVFFAFMFIEMVSWFSLWVTLRDERRAILAKNERKRAHTHTE
ncbi:hypothetical protein VPNG_08341 [Cytospora leucostoma]|uniref:Increased loss of mitochondrial DNA protein 1 n=1 Tax=Cytospora leucostoma TaxID=1230097 RepID=A0A423W9R2_9PEZI|nr:hypothetical protein VPNG_08341 [Cytospora leucostoma]